VAALNQAVKGADQPACDRLADPGDDQDDDDARRADCG
jgi:hypothetical protein